MKKIFKLMDKYGFQFALALSLIGLAARLIENDEFNFNSFFNKDEKDPIVVLLLVTMSIGIVGVILPKIVSYVEDGSTLYRRYLDIEASFSEGHIVRSVKNKVPNVPPNENEIKLSLIEEQTKLLQNGITLQIDKISRSGTVNLVIGLSLTVVAILILINVIYSDAGAYLFDETTQSAYKFFIHAIPRFSLVVFIEIFSFFFLNLYKKSHDDIKYFHNERTNIDSKIIALKAAILLGNSDLLDKIILNYSNVERNFTIKKNDTTIDIEKTKLENSQNSNLIAQLTDVLKNFKA